MQLIKNQLGQVCPSCGAPLQINHFILYCPYCGHTEPANGIDYLDSSDKTSTAKVYDTIQHNSLHIKKCGIVNLKTSGSEIRLCMSSPFYPNDGHFRLIDNTSFRLTYTNNSNEEHILVSVDSNLALKGLDPYLAFLLNNEYVVQTHYIDTIDSKYYFETSCIEFSLICFAYTVDVSTNLIEEQSADYHELKTYCRRFYNQIFDRTKYLYSLNTKLLSDNH